MSNKQINMECVDRVENLDFMPLEQNYLRVQLLKTALIYGMAMLLALGILLLDDFDYRYELLAAIECGGVLLGGVNMLLVQKAFSYKGYAIREHDFTYRSGILVRSVTTIPFSKIQQVSVCQNPLSRLYGLYSVDLVNGAQMLSSTTIPGLTAEKAQQIKALVISNIRHENC